MFELKAISPSSLKNGKKKKRLRSCQQFILDFFFFFLDDCVKLMPQNLTNYHVAVADIETNQE